MYLLPSFCQSAGPVSGRSLSHALAGRPAQARALVLAPFVRGDLVLSPLSIAQAATLGGVSYPYVAAAARLDPIRLDWVLAGTCNLVEAARFSHEPFLNALKNADSIETVDAVIAAAGVETVWNRLTAAL
jgi:hypothetical protein